jgi:hypothetical protein
VASAVEAEKWAVADVYPFMLFSSFAHGSVLFKLVCATALHAAALVWFYLAGLGACLVSQEVTSAADD